MTRQEAVSAIYEIINSGILDSEIEDNLTEVCNHICADDFEKCKCNGSSNCCGCPFIVCESNCDSNEE